MPGVWHQSGPGSATLVLLFHGMEAWGGELHPCVPASLCPCIPVSLHPCVLASLWPCIPVSLQPYSPVSLCPCTLAPLSLPSPAPQLWIWIH